jgi:hypothetical protein
MNKRITFWYVRPIGSHTNNSLARYLRENAKDLNDGDGIDFEKDEVADIDLEDWNDDIDDDVKFVEVIRKRLP